MATQYRNFKTALANAIFVFHVIVFAIVFFGWLFPSLWSLYVLTLAIVLISDLTLGYCFLSKWEFTLRKMINPHLKYDYNFSSYYTKKIIGKALPTPFVRRIGMLFVGGSLFINLYFHFLY